MRGETEALAAAIRELYQLADDAAGRALALAAARGFWHAIRDRMAGAGSARAAAPIAQALAEAIEDGFMPSTPKWAAIADALRAAGRDDVLPQRKAEPAGVVRVKR